jgi:hypothetical protein
VAPVNRPVLEAAMELDFGDYEDAVLYEAARQASVQTIVTRNPRDFKTAELPVVLPAEFLQVLEQRQRESADSAVA